MEENMGSFLLKTIARSLCVFFLVFTVGISFVQAKPLRFYRTQYSNLLPKTDPTVERTEARAAERIGTIRTLLKTQQYSFAFDASFAHDDPHQTGRKTSSSGVLKPYLDRSIDLLMERDTYERPAVFDPGAIPDSQRVMAQKEYIKNFLALSKILQENKRTIEQLIEDYSAYQTFIDTRASAKETAVVGPPPPVVSERIQKVESYLKTQDPMAQQEPTQQILTRLGTLKDVEMVDGHVNRLRFQSALPGSPEVSLTLSMLVTYVTESDLYFLSLSRTILTFVEKRLEKTTARKKELDAMWWHNASEKKENVQISGLLALDQKILPLLKAKYDGAVVVHQLLDRLESRQVRFILDLFLQHQVPDCLSVAETAPLSDSELSPFQSIMQSAQADQQLNQNEVQEDILYYQLLEQQLGSLTLYLEEENAKLEAHGKDLDALKTPPRALQTEPEKEEEEK